MHSIPNKVSAYVDAASEAAGSRSPFWNSESEEVREEGMYQLAFELDVEDREKFLESLPKGYSAVHWIFTWEQSRAGEGFCTGTDNSGVETVEQAAFWYAYLGMTEEAAALKEMLCQYMITPGHVDAVDTAYHSIENPYFEDWDRIPRVVYELCNRARELFYDPA
ncbi:MAG: hypothetical protein ABW101_08850 [Candidatus Thiodiazotropha sp.]